MMKHDRPEISIIWNWISRERYVRMHGDLERFGIIWDDLRVIVCDDDVRKNAVTGVIELLMPQEVFLSSSGGSSEAVVGNWD